MPDRFSHIVVSNTGLISAEGIRARIGYPLLKLAVWWEGEMTFEEMIERANFRSWIAYAYHDKNLAVGKLMRAMGRIDDVCKEIDSIDKEVGAVQFVEKKPLAFGLMFIEVTAIIQDGEEFDNPLGNFEDLVKSFEGVTEIETLEMGRL